MTLISREKIPTDTGKKLYDLLKNIWDDEEFIYGVLVDLRGDENKQKMIDAIEKDGLNDISTINLLSLDIRDGIYP